MEGSREERHGRSLGEDAQPPARALLSDQIHFVLVPVIDLEFGRGAGGLGNDLALAKPAGVREEFFLEVLGDPFLNYDIVGIALEKISIERVGCLFV